MPLTYKFPGKVIMAEHQTTLLLGYPVGQGRIFVAGFAMIIVALIIWFRYSENKWIDEPNRKTAPYSSDNVTEQNEG
jgi:hypothetical protein